MNPKSPRNKKERKKLKKETSEKIEKQIEKVEKIEQKYPLRTSSNSSFRDSSTQLSNGSKKAKKKPIRKQSATHKEDDNIIQ